jgi:hypothetical protein
MHMSEKRKYIMVASVVCPGCGDKIFSRARHDMRYCTCESTAIDGGFDYVKLSFTGALPPTKRMRVYATREELYSDWNSGKDKFGKIRPSKKDKSGMSQTEGWINVIRNSRTR